VFSTNAITANIPEGVDSVVHLGAFTPKAGAQANDLKGSTSNVSSTLALLLALSEVPPRSFVFASTVDVYGPSNGAISESEAERPVSLYGWSKLYCERMVLEWCARMGVTPQVLRVGHIYGPGEDAYKKLIPETARKLVARERPKVFSSGEERRSFLHVDDCARALLAATELASFTGPINVVSATAASVKEIVEILVKCSGLAVVPEIVGGAKGADAVFDATRMNTLLGTETIALRDGLQGELEYFRGKQ